MKNNFKHIRVAKKTIEDLPNILVDLQKVNTILAPHVDYVYIRMLLHTIAEVQVGMNRQLNAAKNIYDKKNIVIERE